MSSLSDICTERYQVEPDIGTFGMDLNVLIIQTPAGSSELIGRAVIGIKCSRMVRDTFRTMV
jgi:hypothetical protein